MIDHISLQVDDLATTSAWYDVVLGPLGIVPVVEVGNVVGYGKPNGAPKFWLGTATEPNGRQTHIAFTAADRESVDAVHQAALGQGLEVMNAPREWPEYHPGYYAVFVRDPAGNNVEAVCHTAP
jgi:catechol 2,3-dioxygenase-like lactoylglutathione lyase family enzyme